MFCVFFLFNNAPMYLKDILLLFKALMTIVSLS